MPTDKGIHKRILDAASHTPDPKRAEANRITSYNVCYTKLLRNADADQDSIVVSPSLWQVHFGIKYKF